VRKDSELGRRKFFKSAGGSVVALAIPAIAAPPDRKQTILYSSHIVQYLHSFPAIDSHDHLRPFEALWGYLETERGRGMNLFSLWSTSYYQDPSHLATWNPGERFDTWWERAKPDFDSGRATTFYRYMLSAFKDLYGVDFDAITDG
jgi:hypothetical protein